MEIVREGLKKSGNRTKKEQKIVRKELDKLKIKNELKRKQRKK
ncbi:hypothetical protein [Methanosarcina sp. DH2]|nr:hypothetical protein [Methanosarcina sp. DH2]